MRDCRTTDDRLFDFVDGLDPDLEGHVATCDDCQEFLAELWIGELPMDLAQPVLRQIRFDEFLSELGQLTMDVAAAMGKAFIAFGPGIDEALAEADDASLPPTGDDEE